MRQLHVVGVSRDGRSLVLSSDPEAPRGGYRLVVDERLHAALRGDVGRPGSTGKPESKLSPREIQSRLRAGQSPEEVAKVAGVPLARVERYAGPVLAERQRVLDQAMAAHFVKARRGASAWPLGRAVAAHLDTLAGLDPDSVTWEATRDPAGTWVVRLDYVVSGRRRKAQWAWDAAADELRALDTNAGNLAHLDAPPEGPSRVRRRARSGEGSAAGGSRTTGSAPAAASGRGRAATSSPGRRAVGPSSPPAAGPAAAEAPQAPAAVEPSPPAQPSRPARATASAAGTDREVTPPETTAPEGDAPESDAADAAQEAPQAARPRRPAPRRAPRARIGGESSADVLPLRPGRRRRRASVPSWDDVLLGGGASGSREDDERSDGELPRPSGRDGAPPGGRSAPRWRRRRVPR